ncbi:tetratricopeptide repeat protein [Rubrivivax sp. RP6-9]|uniref:tetratricopeptide repeat protein n=1 Tax=Rubrivivax sp. RP6-9 TaxID=3415750 RepID=UPI003CC68E67
MSYTVQLWEQPAGQPLPADAAQVWTQLQGLLASPDAPGARLHALARQLRAQFPGDDTDGDADDSVFAEGPPDAGGAGAVWVLALSHHHPDFDRVHAVIAARAMALGLNMADEQAAELYLADGRVFGDRPGAQCVHAMAAYTCGDLPQAWQGFLELSGRGNGAALRNLAVMAINGETVPRHPALGLALLTLAGCDDDAAPLRRQLRPDRLAEADTLLQRLRQPGQLVPVVRSTVAQADSLSGLSLVPLADEAAAASGAAAPPASPAVQALEQRARQGDREACLALGRHYKAGDGVARDDTQAVRWWTQAAEQGLPQAQFNLGVSLSAGAGTARDDTLALKWFGLAADQGHAEATYNLGVMHLRGIGMPADPVAGKALLTVALQRGSTRAKVPASEPAEQARVVALAALLAPPGQLLSALAAWRRRREALVDGAAAAPAAATPAAPATASAAAAPDAPPVGTAPVPAARKRTRDRPDRAQTGPQSRSDRNHRDGRDSRHGSSGRSTRRRKTRSGAGPLGLAAGVLGTPLLLLLAPTLGTAAFRVLLGLVCAAAAWGVWRVGTALGLGRAKTLPLAALALVPLLNLAVCLGLGLLWWRRRH